MFKPYEGTEPYIFASYARKNKHIIDPVLEAMNRVGYRVWYDEGVHLAEKWYEVIMEHAYNCAAFIAFLSSDSVESEYCENEIFSAWRNNKPILSVFLEDVKLPPKLDFLNQRLFISYVEPEKFLRKLDETPAFEQCRKPRQENSDVPAKTEVPQKPDNVQSKPDTQRKETAKRTSPNDPIRYRRSEEIRKERKENFDTCRARFKVLSVIALITLALTILAYYTNKTSGYFVGGRALCFVMGLTVLCVFMDYSSAHDDWERVRNRLSTMQWYVTRDGVLTISNAGESEWGIVYRDYTPAGSVPVPNGFKKLGIQSIIIETGISEIYGYSFQNYEYLTSVEIPESVKKIHSHAFENCKKLKSVTIPAGTDYEKYAFPPWTDIHRE
ncbi:MAG: TIR domain-containing protein [Oscillibacter sp.]|nr:TIR domain-containing protein [Oscillibacter sp.]